MSRPARNGERFDLVVFDADDTLWRSEDYFSLAEQFFADQVGPYAPDGVDVLADLHRIEVGNVPVSGYGVKPYALSMVEAAVHVTGGTVPSSVILALVEYSYDMLQHPVELLDGVADTLAELHRSHHLALITKGDLLHQMRKFRASGLAPLFGRVRVVEEKDTETYREVFTEWSVTADRTLMVGNSIRSDVLPVLELGGYGIHVPYHTTWSHEHVNDHPGGFTELPRLADLPAWLADTQGG
ncbi:MAG TPA: HAD family hydrolase [Ilumatobacter sp.]|nr:HAD family hydrolase [Ilumatobacter sp.]